MPSKAVVRAQIRAFKREKSPLIRGALLLSVAFVRKDHPEAEKLIEYATEDEDKDVKAKALELIAEKK